MKYCFGIDIGRYDCQVGIISGGWKKIRDKWEIKTDRGEKDLNILPGYRQISYEQTGKEEFQEESDRYRNRRPGSDYGGGICEIYRQPRMGREKCQSRDGRG